MATFYYFIDNLLPNSGGKVLRTYPNW